MNPRKNRGWTTLGVLLCGWAYEAFAQLLKREHEIIEEFQFRFKRSQQSSDRLARLARHIQAGGRV
jgi:hypothetical protein